MVFLQHFFHSSNVCEASRIILSRWTPVQTIYMYFNICIYGADGRQAAVLRFSRSHVESYGLEIDIICYMKCGNTYCSSTSAIELVNDI